MTRDGVRRQRSGAAWRAAPNTLARMRAAARLMVPPWRESRWFGWSATINGGAPIEERPWHRRFDVDRHAWLFEQLDRNRNKKLRIFDRELLQHAIRIDQALIACIFDRSVASPLERLLGSPEEAKSLAEFHEILAAQAQRFQPPSSNPLTRTAPAASSRKRTTAFSMEYGLRQRLKSARTSRERLEAVREVHFGFKDSRQTARQELDWLIKHVTAASTPGELVEAWFGVSPYTRRHVVIAGCKSEFEIYRGLMLDGVGMLKSCEAAKSDAAFVARPAKAAERAAVEIIRRACTDVIGPRAWLTKSGGIGDGRGVNFARNVLNMYGISWSDRFLLPPQ